MNEIQLLKEAEFEITRLRNENEKMRLRLDMFDNLMFVLNTEPHRVGGYCSQDIAYEIKTFIQAKEDEKLLAQKQAEEKAMEMASDRLKRNKPIYSL